jgi:multiple sugar transport system substrate-binding protein
MKETMDDMIEEFNGTVGTKEGIFISETSISGSSTLHDKLTMAANGDPGAPDLPDITTAYPKTALILAEKGLLVDLDELFTNKELSAYIPRFIEEGRLDGDKLYVFPTAKSTEVLFVNTTIFNRFATDTGASLDDLRTFEGLFKTAGMYYDWTDRQTPDIPNDGKTFYVPDSLFNLTLIGCKQLGTDFLKDNAIDYSNPVTRTVWDSYMKSAVQGHSAIFDGYASDLAKTGDIVCSTGSTAGIAFFDKIVTYPDNTTETAELMVLPYPVFEGGEKVAVQRGSGMLVTKSNDAKEYAAGIFLKWFTSPENNIRFITSTGYLPVTKTAFENIISSKPDNIEDNNTRTLFKAAVEMYKGYDFCIPPIFDGIDVLQKDYETNLKKAAAEGRNTYKALLEKLDSKTAFDEAEKGAFEGFIK